MSTCKILEYWSTGVLEYWSVDYKSGKRSDFYSFTLIPTNPITVHIIPLLHHSITPERINFLF
jgi:hypothetical protein